MVSTVHQLGLGLIVRRRIIFLCLVVAQLIVVAAAEACRIPRRPVIPVQGDYDAVILGTVVSEDEYSATVRTDESLDGSVDDREISLTVRFAPGFMDSCGPRGPVVRPSERVVVVLARQEGRQFVKGWTTLEFAMRADDFFDQYQRARRQSDKRRLRERWRQVNRFRGPVPLSDPESWMPPHVGALGWVGPDGLVYAQFDVTQDGRVANCRPTEQGRSDLRTQSICDAIRARRFAPPMFAREREGIFRVRWNGSPLSPR